MILTEAIQKGIKVMFDEFGLHIVQLMIKYNIVTKL